MEKQTKPTPSTDIEFYTNRELIEELSKRKTFVGAIIWYKDEYRGGKYTEKDFIMRSRNISIKDIAQIMFLFARALFIKAKS